MTLSVIKTGRSSLQKTGTMIVWFLAVLTPREAPGGTTGLAASLTSTVGIWATKLPSLGCTGIAGRTATSP